jgi:glycosyltransferase involved in cell wall biosynthesis
VRVAHIGNFNVDSADGTEKTIAGLATWLPSYGVDVEVWQLSNAVSRVCHRSVDGVQVWDVPAYTRPLNFARGLTSAARGFVLERQREVSHVHFHSGFVPEVPPITDLLEVPYVMTPNGMYSAANVRGRDGRFKRAWLRWREAPRVRGAALLHAVSDGEAHILQSAFPEVPCVLIPNALDLQALPVAASDSGAPGQPRLLYLGRLAVEQKGLDLLLRAYALFLARSGDTRTRLQLVGPDYRDGLARLRALALQLGLDERVEFADPVFGTAKWRLLSEAHAFVHPSRWDGLPFSVLEAMAAARPVLVTPGTNLFDVVRSYGAGIGADGSVDAIADGLERLVALDEAAWNEMGDAARNLVEARFTWPEAAARMADAYRRIQSSHREAIAHVA